MLSARPSIRITTSKLPAVEEPTGAAGCNAEGLTKQV